MSKIEERVIEKIRQRAARGFAKYGTTMEREDFTFLDWLIYLQEELLDSVVYLEKLIEKSQEEEISDGNIGDAC